MMEIAALGSHCRRQESKGASGGVSSSACCKFHRVQGLCSNLIPLSRSGLLHACRESMHFDLLVVGAGPSGLAAAIRFKQVNNKCLELFAAAGAASLGPFFWAPASHRCIEQGVCSSAQQMTAPLHEAIAHTPCSCARRRAKT